jgi:hypothetical protein
MPLNRTDEEGKVQQQDYIMQKKSVCNDFLQLCAIESGLKLQHYFNAMDSVLG